jgi:hypothetical protein
MIDFTPSIISKKVVKDSDKDWINTDEPQVILYQGMRGGGKGVSVDYTAEKFYKEGMTVLHVWGARSFENLYWMINKNCGLHHGKLKIIMKSFLESYYNPITEINYKNFKINVKLGLKDISIKNGLTSEEYDEYLQIAINGNLITSVSEKKYRITEHGLRLANDIGLYCKCHKAYPITLVVPNYIKFVDHTVDNFNLENSPSWVDPIGIKRITKPLLKIRHIIPPTNTDKRKKFNDEMTDIILEARKESRIVVMNPSFFEDSDKFDTLGAIIDMLPYMMNSSGHFTPLNEKAIGKPKKYWTKKQKSHHKLAIIINEIKSVAPGAGMYSDRKAGTTRRSVKDKITEMRHFKTWLCADFQNPSDIDGTLRVQSNFIVVKRSARDILGDSWKWLFDKIAIDRMNLVRHNLKGFEINRPEDAEKILRRKGSKFRKLKKYVDDRRPLIEEMDTNVGYVTAQGMSVRRRSFPLPSFHHKTSLEDFKGDTGIEWVVDLDDKQKENIIKDEMTKTDRKTGVQKKKELKETIMKRIHQMRTVGKKSFAEIKTELIVLQNEGIIPDMGYAERKPIYFNILYNRWSKDDNLE